MKEKQTKMMMIRSQRESERLPLNMRRNNKYADSVNLQGIEIEFYPNIVYCLYAVAQDSFDISINWSLNVNLDVHWDFHLLLFAAVSDDPEFTDIIENMTVPAGRSVKLACSVKNLGNYKVSGVGGWHQNIQLMQQLQWNLKTNQLYNLNVYTLYSLHNNSER